MTPAATTPRQLFVYGTLRAAELRELLLGRPIMSVAGRLNGYACRRLRRAAYPGLVAAANEHCDGEVIEDLKPRDFEKLDEFETDLYDRIIVDVVCRDEIPLRAYCYVLAAHALPRVTDETWDYSAFRQRNLARYLRAMS